MQTQKAAFSTREAPLRFQERIAPHSKRSKASWIPRLVTFLLLKHDVYQKIKKDSDFVLIPFV